MDLKTLVLLLLLNATASVNSICIPVCQNSGSCVSSACSCVNDYSGPQCSVNPGCTPDPCNGNGVCTNTQPADGTYTCSCTGGWTGTNCDGTPPPCTSWSVWGACPRPCGGCVQHTRTRTCTDASSMSESEVCNVNKCVTGLDSPYEYFYQTVNGLHRRYGRHRLCCYNFNVSPAVATSRPIYCLRPKVGGWT